MSDFTSALYLGLRHPSASLGAWEALSLGMPAALREPPGAVELAADLARLVGTQAATLSPSTLHLFWDLFRVPDGTGDQDGVILLDAGTYPIARWGIERAAAFGMPIEVFPRHDAATASRLVRKWRRLSRRPVVVADGFSPGCGKAAPLADYAEIACSAQGYLVVDDTQALGVFGHSPDESAPYGRDGGGSLQRHGVFGAHVVVGASLAKGFGVPIAVLAASRDVVRQFETHSETRMHTSPPSVAVIRAAQCALAINREIGERLRLRLCRSVARLRAGMTRLGLLLRGGMFPVQTLASTPSLNVMRLHAQLQRHGIQTVLHPGRHANDAQLSFLVTARHTLDEIDCAVDRLAQCMHAQGPATDTQRSTHRKNRYDLLEAS